MFSILVNYYIQVSLILKVILYVAKMPWLSFFSVFYKRTTLRLHLALKPGLNWKGWKQHPEIQVVWKVDKSIYMLSTR